MARNLQGGSDELATERIRTTLSSVGKKKEEVDCQELETLAPLHEQRVCFILIICNPCTAKMFFFMYKKWYSLYDKVYTKANLLRSFQQVKRNGGGAGIDGQTLEEFFSESPVLSEPITRRIIKQNLCTASGKTSVYTQSRREQTPIRNTDHTR